MVHPELESQIEFVESAVQVLVIENQNAFARYTRELYDQVNGIDGAFVLSEEGELQKISKCMDIVFDYYFLQVNSRRVITKLYANVKTEMNSGEYFKTTNELATEICNYLERIIAEMQLPLEYNVNFDLSGILKVVDLRIHSDPESLTEKLIDYMLATKEFCGVNYFIFIGLKNYLSEEELEKIYQEISYQKYGVLLIEGTERGERMESEIYYVIDKDLCEIY